MSQQWLEVALVGHNDDEVLLLETALEIAGAVSITYSAADETEIFEPPIGTTPLWLNTRVTGLFPLGCNPEEVSSLLNIALDGQFALEKNLLTDKDWVRAWLDYFKPIQFSDHFWVAATEHQIDDQEAVVLRLDPGLAFGTGTHPSTAMCINYIVNQANIQDKRVYDYGCGSGILGITAALCGAEKVWLTDIDPQALTASALNAEKNKVQDKIVLLDHPDLAPKVDLLVANILLEPLCALKTQFEKHINQSSTVLFAGILEHQLERIFAVYEKDYQIELADQVESWVLLKLKAKIS